VQLAEAIAIARRRLQRMLTYADVILASLEILGIIDLRRVYVFVRVRVCACVCVYVCVCVCLCVCTD
jgi:hypothetical protein